MADYLAAEVAEPEEDTIESLALELEQTRAQLDLVLDYLQAHNGAAVCAHCGRVALRREMFAPDGVAHDLAGVEYPAATTWCCGNCVLVALDAAHEDPAVRKRIAAWLLTREGSDYLDRQSPAFYGRIEAYFSRELAGRRGRTM